MPDSHNIRHQRVEEDGLPPIPFYEGYMACARGWSCTSNPYTWGQEAKDWSLGWAQYRTDQLFGSPVDPPPKGFIV